MPGFDRSGPMGAGSMTGGRRGPCGQSGVVTDPSAYGGFGYGRGLGFRRGAGRGSGPGRGGGRGFGRGFYGYPPRYPVDYSMGRTEEMDMLKAEANAMKKSLEAVQKRIEELDRYESSE
ncbi:MAG: DUF5320 domain-containing protein [Desulfosarcina sp.]|nr:DUF5320 domain-containing protein [Desulfosarcina sp.]MBC2743934.1 DUF5320 domain-containing protein [Desulfosarcina sp.]MBC2766843.1 DUF5320 domain-containing protein [Desulfosarcina sp.]